MSKQEKKQKLSFNLVLTDNYCQDEPGMSYFVSQSLWAMKPANEYNELID